LGLVSDISEESVRHLASLARIALTDDEVIHLTSELSQIMDAVASVQEVATSEVPATSHPIPLSNVYRPDVVADVIPTDKALASAPEHDGSRFKVSAILGEEQ
jgi:aspartyl-tRNA(Asn)/glutamyl-tRNA(Gln) amidotransferase subunit C